MDRLPEYLFFWCVQDSKLLFKIFWRPPSPSIQEETASLFLAFSDLNPDHPSTSSAINRTGESKS
jgi:hypothetical protein